MEKHPTVSHTDGLFLWSAGRGLTVGTSSKWLVTGGKRIHKLCRISPACEPGASRAQCGASGLDLAPRIAVSLTTLRRPQGEGRLFQIQVLGELIQAPKSSLDACDHSCLVEI